jgi:hypothetical protein
MNNVLEIKSVWSHHYDLDTYVPADVYDVGIWLDFRAGFIGSVGADDFRVFVCTPKYLSRLCLGKSFVWAKNYLIIEKYEFILIQIALNDMLKNVVYSVPDEAMKKLGRFAEWEFEDYKNNKLL